VLLLTPGFVTDVFGFFCVLPFTRPIARRPLAGLLRTAAATFGYPAKDCYLKDFLCMECPRCVLFGATNVSGSGERANIKHRLEYSTAFSLTESADSGTATTFNAVDEKTLSTGQALGVRFAASPGTVFPSIVTLRSVTQDEFIWTIKTLMASKSYGAESRIGGDCRNLIVGFVAGWEEIITSLEWCLELNAKSLEEVKVGEVLRSYKAMAANQNQVQILDEGETQAVLDEVSAFVLDAEFVKRSFEAAKRFRASQVGQAGGHATRRR